MIQKKIRMNAASRYFLAVAACTVLGVMAGCIHNRIRMENCAVILLIDGKHIKPTRGQLDAVRRALGPAFETRGLSIVSDLVRADVLATIELRPDHGNALRTEMILRDISPNSYMPAIPSPAHSSRSEAERVHAAAERER